MQSGCDKTTWAEVYVGRGLWYSTHLTKLIWMLMITLKIATFWFDLFCTQPYILVYKSTQQIS